MAPPSPTVAAGRPGGRAASPPPPKKHSAQADENVAANQQSVKDPKTVRPTKGSKVPTSARSSRLARVACGAALGCALVLSAAVGFYLGFGEVNSARLVRDLLQHIPTEEELRTAARPLTDLFPHPYPVAWGVVPAQFAVVVGLSSIVAIVLSLKLATAGLRVVGRMPGKLWAMVGKKKKKA